MKTANFLAPTRTRDQRFDLTRVTVTTNREAVAIGSRGPMRHVWCCHVLVTLTLGLLHGCGDGAPSDDQIRSRVPGVYAVDTHATAGDRLGDGKSREIEIWT